MLLTIYISIDSIFITYLYNWENYNSTRQVTYSRSDATIYQQMPLRGFLIAYNFGFSIYGVFIYVIRFIFHQQIALYLFWVYLRF